MPACAVSPIWYVPVSRVFLPVVPPLPTFVADASVLEPSPLLMERSNVPTPLGRLLTTSRSPNGGSVASKHSGVWFVWFDAE